MNITGKVIRGKGRGKSVLGFPTANIIYNQDERFTHRHIKPLEGKEGAWFAKVNIHSQGITNAVAVCGICKKGDKYIIETHILDFDGDLYDTDIVIYLQYKIRGLVIFKTLDESKEQMIKDIDFVRRYRSCASCKFCVHQDHGYSNYTVEGTDISCLANKFESYDEGYGDNYANGLATNCELYNEGEHWDIDVDGESTSPEDEWVKSELREVKLKIILK